MCRVEGETDAQSRTTAYLKEHRIAPILSGILLELQATALRGEPLPERPFEWISNILRKLDGERRALRASEPEGAAEPATTIPDPPAAQAAADHEAARWAFVQAFAAAPPEPATSGAAARAPRPSRCASRRPSFRPRPSAGW